MRILLLLLLTLVAVIQTKAGTKKASQYLLMEIMESVNEILKDSQKNDGVEKMLNHFVHDVFHHGGCSDNTLCQAAMILKNTKLNHSMLQRQLFSYAEYIGINSCHVSASEQYSLKQHLKEIKKCAQDQYLKLLQKHKR